MVKNRSAQIPRTDSSHFSPPAIARGTSEGGAERERFLMEIADWERRVPRVGNELDQVFTTTSLEEVRGTAEGERGEEYRISNKEIRMSK